MFVEILISILLIWLVTYFFQTFKKRQNVPPGPFPFPFIGNLPHLGADPPFTMDKLWKKYGDVYLVKFPVGMSVIVNSCEAVREALVTRKDDFSGRPIHSSYPFNIITEGRGISSSDYGAQLMFRQKMIGSAVNVFGNEVKQLEEQVNSATEELLNQVGQMDGQTISLKVYVPAVITSQLWEWLSSRKYHFDDHALTTLVEFSEKMKFLLRLGGIFQLLPFLKYLPTKFMKTLEEVLVMRGDIFGSVVEEHRRTYTKGVVRDVTDCLIAACEAEQTKTVEKNGASVDDIKFLLMDMLFTGADTSTTVVLWFILHILLRKDLQVKLQQELDAAVGRDRLPLWEDIKNLPYLQATVCEVIRYSTPLPLVPHKTIRDTTIQGYHVPKGTPVFINFYRVHLDPKEWDDPTLFKPERFLDANGKFIGWTSVSAFMPFGIGRRECPCQNLAKLQVFSVISCLLHQFTFEQDCQGLYPIIQETSPGFVNQPMDYKVIARKRS